MQNLNFVPDWYRASLRRKNDLLVQVGAIVCLTGAMVVWSLHNAAGIRSVRTSLAVARTSLEHQQLSWTELHDLERLIAERDQKSELVAAICGGVSAADLLTELSHLMPPGAVLTEVSIVREDRLPGLESGSPKAVQLAAAPGDGTGSIEIDGLASGNTVVGEFHTELVQSPAFVNVDMKYSRPVEFDGRKARRFRFECRLPRFE